jgi:hypothetical protein
MRWVGPHRGGSGATNGGRVLGLVDELHERKVADRRIVSFEEPRERVAAQRRVPGLRHEGHSSDEADLLDTLREQFRAPPENVPSARRSVERNPNRSGAFSY